MFAGSALDVGLVPRFSITRMGLRSAPHPQEQEHGYVNMCVWGVGGRKLIIYDPNAMEDGAEGQRVRQAYGTTENKHMCAPHLKQPTASTPPASSAELPQKQMAY